MFSVCWSSFVSFVRSRNRKDDTVRSRRLPELHQTALSVRSASLQPRYFDEVDSGGGGSAEVMVYSLGWGMGEPERRGAERKRQSSSHALLSPTSPCDDVVDVLPLHNQVGGHTRLLVLNDSTVIKPLNIRELHFYQNIPEDIKSFVPRYKGVMQASSAGGAKPDKRYSPCFRDDGRKPSLTGKRKRDDVFKFKVHRNGNASEVLKSIAHMDNSNKQYFLMMENITSSYTRPCVLDVKMGTRQHGDDASAEKRSKQIAKCQASTSAALGVRLCGMQVYDGSGSCVRRDKYWGRSLSEAGLRDALRAFFATGAPLRRRVVRRVLQDLDELRHAVAKQTNYRFYSCSLLIVYEGGSEEESPPPPSAPAAAEGEREPFTPHSEETMGGYEEPTAGELRRAPSPDSADSWTAYCSTSGESWPDKRAPPEPRVDIRMIDFAHTALAGADAASPLATAAPHHGPDCGFLTGVDSLKRLLTEILQQPYS
ncbi:hypothetical protein JYU34_005696 [Plutella xylostella]|uniref:Kinase n=1 Tax=Plutella xylostella TaxID=51655 RepID=A0ABQ7QTW3_PLUXY|nr:hypothetical protein JYU34_005696 [Plutella xylostella]